MFPTTGLPAKVIVPGVPALPMMASVLLPGQFTGDPEPQVASHRAAAVDQVPAPSVQVLVAPLVQVNVAACPIDNPTSQTANASNPIARRWMAIRIAAPNVIGAQAWLTLKRRFFIRSFYLIGLMVQHTRI